MKWFAHDNDLHELPLGQEIIARLGWAGYGRALALLETLTKLVPNDGQGIFQLPLAKPTDICFWARKFQQPEEETEQTFDVFEEAKLIAPWREKRMICAPLLGERLDEYTKRTSKRARKKDAEGDDPDGGNNGGGARRKNSKTDSPDSRSQSHQHEHKHRQSHSQSQSHSSRQYRDNVPTPELIEEQADKIKATQKQKPTDQPLFSNDDVTVTAPETVGDRFEQLEYEPADKVVRLISDGAFHLAALTSYPDEAGPQAIGKLGEACCQAVLEMMDEPFEGRRTCAEVMSRAMELLDHENIKAPRGWLPVLKKLREDGGPATASKSKAERMPSGAELQKFEASANKVLTDPECAFAAYRKELEPFEAMLIDAAGHRAIPGSFSEGAAFLDAVINARPDCDPALVEVRDKMRGRVPATSARG